MTSPYWPLVQEVDACIRTEAEELADGVVLAVHEPMTFRRLAARESIGEIVDESQLLEHVVKMNRPTPIIGESGFGKSHVIRWLHLQLTRYQRQDWHIVRIGKNASLRQALTTLLAGLPGSVFDDARRKIESVGAGLKTRDVAEHLVIFLNARLTQLFDEEKKQACLHDASGGSVREPDAEQRRRIRAIRKHAKPTGIANLLGDPNFKLQFLAEDGCFYQIAKRLTQGATDEEIETLPRELQPGDLDVKGNIGDLSSSAQLYVRDAQLNTSEASRIEVTALLNECLNDASRAAFQQLFQFHGGSFQDLFIDLRETLGEQGKTLFILIEDMAAISAIEDVLIDSLMQEDVRAGKRELCPLHSAIAVTTGYSGYARRQATISTRARYEWFIEKSAVTESETLVRIEDFCGRYLNAARHGQHRLVQTFGDGQVDVASWPGIWKSEETHFSHTAATFGVSASGYPLFPYTKPSLTAMARRYCQIGDTLEFNPRKILAHILSEPLRNFREAYSNGLFPPEGFAEIPCPLSLQTDLRRQVRDDLDRVETMAAIWGYGARNVAELAHKMGSAVPTEFGLLPLARLLENTEPQQPPPTSIPPVDPQVPPRSTRGGTVVPNANPIVGAQSISEEIDQYFRNRSIPQAEANELRKELADAFASRKDDLSDWYGIKTWPEIKQRSLTLITIPFNSNNPPGAKLKFGTEEEFQDRNNSLKYREFMVAVLRRNKAPKAAQMNWDYAEGEQDYVVYTNFIDTWIPVAASILAAEGKAAAKNNIEAQLSAATVIDPMLPNREHLQQLDQLLMTAEAVKSKINFATGLPAWDQFLDAHITGWDKTQDAWMDVYSRSRYGIEGDLVIAEIKKFTDVSVPIKAQTIAQRVAQDVARQYPSLHLLDGCTTVAEFKELMDSLETLVLRLSATAQFQGMDKITQAVSYSASIKQVTETDKWKSLSSALSLRLPFEAVSTLKALHGFDLGAIQSVTRILEIWEQLDKITGQRIRNENEEQGVGRRTLGEAALSAKIDELEGLVAECKATSE